MANYATLKAAINAVIKANGQREITGTVLNQTLNAMVNSLGANYQLAGVATPSTNPGTPDQNVFYLAFEAGTYTNFNAIVLSAGISILMWNGSWSSQTFYTIDATPTASSGNLVSSGAVFGAIKTDGSAYDVSEHFPTGGPNSDGKFTLEYILSNANTLIPVSWRKGGMSIRFVSTSDNKYVQWRLMATTWSTNVSDWQSVYNSRHFIPWFITIGQGQTFVWSKSIEVIAGHTYRFSIKNTNVSMTGVTSGHRFGIYTESGNFSSSLIYVSYTSALQEHYDIAIPSGVSSVYFGMRCATGVEFNISVIDISAAREVDEIKNNTITIAAYDSTAEAKANADIVASSESAGIAAINTAIQSLTNGGRVYLRNGTYGGTDYVNINKEDIVIEGESLGAYINRNSVNPSCIVASEINHTIIKTCKLKNGCAGTRIYENVITSDSYIKTTPINSEYSIAASDSSELIKKAANVVCSGTNDDYIINQALLNLPSGGGTVKLCAGTYVLETTLTLQKSNTVLIGDFGATKLTYSGSFSNSNAIQTANSSLNCTVIGIDAGAKNISLTASGSGYVYMSTYLNKYHTFSALEDTAGLNTYNYLIAASDAPSKFKQLADYVCDGSGDETEIYNCITILKNAGTGGIIQLSPGTFNLTNYINMRGSGVELRGCGYATVINRTNPLALRVEEGAVNCIVRGINFGNHTVEPTYSGNAYVYDCWIGGVYYHNYSYNRQDGIFVPAVLGIAGINNAITLLGNNGGTILLEEGEYTGSSGVDFKGQRITIKGCGAKTIINRSTGVNDVYCNTTTTYGNLLQDLTIANNAQQNGDFPTQRYRIINCWNKGKLIDQTELSNVIINIGSTFFYKSILTPYNIISADNWKYKNRFEFHIHGHIKEESAVYISKAIDFVGHHALVELNGEGSVFITFAGPTAINMEAPYPTVVRDIHFLKTGCFNYRNAPAVMVTSPSHRFENCVFENASSSPSPFDNSAQSHGSEDDNGCRRHGIMIQIERWGEDCKTEFYNCIGIGSPYGFQSTRGWYIAYGSPKLFDCIGYGGGIGEFGHGIILHRASEATMYNCIGYAGKNTYREGAGIRYQAHSNGKMINCIGYGSHGTQIKSNGVPEATILSYCETLGITDTTFLYTGGTFDYANLTVKATDDGYNASRILLGKNIKNTDIQFVELGGVSEQGFGFSFYAHNGNPTLMNCIGYSGHGEYSKGLSVGGKSNPTIIGGYFGYQNESYKKYIVKDAQGYCDFVIPQSQLSEYTPYLIKSVGVTIGDYRYGERHLVFHLETNETTPREVIQPLDIFHTASIGMCISTNIDIPSGVGLKAYITENDNVLTDYPDNFFYVMLTFVANQPTSESVVIEINSTPKISNTLMASYGDGLHISTESNDYEVIGCNIRAEHGGEAVVADVGNIRVFDTCIYGNVNNDITFKAKTFINSSSNYSVNT